MHILECFWIEMFQFDEYDISGLIQVCRLLYSNLKTSESFALTQLRPTHQPSMGLLCGVDKTELHYNTDICTIDLNQIKLV